MSVLVLAVLVMLAAGSTDSGSLSELWSEMEAEMQNDFHPGEIPEGNQILNRSNSGTTVEKKAFREQHGERRYSFAGFVTDVTTDSTATVQMDPSNHATVTFNRSVASLKKGQYISFDATIISFGSGILVNHKLGGADLRAGAPAATRSRNP